MSITIGKKGWGRIINISGLAARGVGTASGSIRNVAVAALTKTLADELGPHGINVTVVHPGWTVTERTGDHVAAYASARGIRAGPPGHRASASQLSISFDHFSPSYRFWPFQRAEFCSQNR